MGSLKRTAAAVRAEQRRHARVDRRRRAARCKRTREGEKDEFGAVS